MANDCKPRIKVAPVAEEDLLPPGSCMEELLPEAPECSESLAAPAEPCCPDDSEERGWYNQPVLSPCSEVIVPYAAIHSTESQEAADARAEFDAYQELDSQPPEWESLTGEITISTPVDVYGALGPEAIRFGGDCEAYCDNLAFCDGPTAEGATMTDLSDRYATRWQAKLEGGYISYRRDGEAWIPVPSELIPQPNTNMSGLGFCFDANARPCFSSQLGDTIHLWRWQAGVAIEYTFYGAGPKLYFNGVLQRDTSLWDVVCYFCLNGALSATLQRDNFAVTHTLFYSPEYYFTRVYLVDHGDGIFASRLYLGVGNTCSVFRTPPYQPWPFFASETGASPAYGVESVEYDRIIVELGAYTESVLSPAYGIESIEYRSLVVDISGPTEEGIVPAYSVESVAYSLVVVALGTYTEGAAAPAYGVESLTYDLISINTGTYTEAGSAPTYGVESITYE